MAVRVAARLAPEWWTPASQAEETEPAQFLLAPLPSSVYLNARACVDDGRYGDAAVMVADASVRGWRGVTIGEDAEFARGKIRELPHGILVEVATEILARATLSETERKNS
ncbi:MAG: hypothetical protein QG586_578 [Pseudomonadota bacterium]|nr:hypothetical protein [Pseudomonadota bacterium]